MTPRRTGSETRAEAQRVALSLFTLKGYDATSLREIADALGITKASLYYHFASKEQIVASIVAGRGSEAAELLTWAREQDDSPELLERTVLRWVETFSVEKLRGIRFVNANPAVLRRAGGVARGGAAGGEPSTGGTAGVEAQPTSAATGDRPSPAPIRDNLEALAAYVSRAETDPVRLLLIRMAFLSINAAVAAAAPQSSDDEIVAAARELARAILVRLAQ